MMPDVPRVGRRRGAFGLVELFLVVAVVLSLVGMAVPLLEVLVRDSLNARLESRVGDWVPPSPPPDSPHGMTRIDFHDPARLDEVMRIHPRTLAQSIPCRWDQPGGALVYSRRLGAGRGRSAYWARVPDPGMRDVPQFNLTASLSVRRLSGAVHVGLFGNYTGPGTGYRARLTLSGASRLELGWGIPDPPPGEPVARSFALARPSKAPSSAGVVLHLDADLSGDEVVLEAQATGVVTTPRVRFTIPRDGLHPRGLVGWFVEAPSAGDEFDVEVSRVVYSRPAS